MKDFYLYVLECRDKSLYIGIAKNPKERLKKHNSGKGSKYVRSRAPATIVYIEGPYTRSEALKLEYRYKQLSRKKKLELINKGE